MKVSLWQLNSGWQALLRLASKELPKKHFKITYKLGRIVDAAKPHIERWTQKSLPELMAQYGVKRLSNGNLVCLDDHEKPATPEMIEGFDVAAKAIMEEDIYELIDERWGPFDAKQILEIEPLRRADREESVITGLDFGELYGWLIVGEIPDELPEPKESEK